MGFHEEWKVIPNNLVGFLTIRRKEWQRKNCQNLQWHSWIQSCNERYHWTFKQRWRPNNIRSLPWLLTEQQSNAVKEVIQKIKFPTGFCSNIKNILTRKGDFGGLKTHDWHIFIKVIIFLVYILVYYNTACFWFTFLPNFEKYIDETCSLLQYVLPVSLPDNFDNNVKQVIYDLGKYMR